MTERGGLLTRRQFYTLCWAALLSPLVRQTPGQVVTLAGRAAWLSALLALLPAAGVAALLALFMRTRRPGEGLGELLCRAVGAGPGRFITLLYGLWLALYAGFVLRSGAERFVATVYPDSSPWLFMAALLALALLAGLGRLKTLARCAEAARLPLALLFLLIFAFSLQGVQLRCLLPLSRSDLPGAVGGAGLLLNTLSIAVFFFFLAGRAEPGGQARELLLPGGSLGALALLLCVTVVGSFGAPLTERMNHAFFSLIQGLRLFDLLERVEALVIAQWIITDFLLLALLLHVCSGALTLGLRGQGALRRRASVLAPAGAALLTALLCAPDQAALQALTQRWVPLGNALLLFGLLPLCLLVGKLRKTI